MPVLKIEAEYMLLKPPKRGRVTHVARRMGEMKTLCGKDAQGWLIVGESPRLVTCKVCRRQVLE